MSMYSTEQLMSDAFLGKNNVAQITLDNNVKVFGAEMLNQWSTEQKSIEHEIDQMVTLYSLENLQKQQKVSMYKKINRSMFNGVDRGMESAINKCVLSLEAEEDGIAAKKQNIFKRAWEAIKRFFKFIGDKIKALIQKIKTFFTKAKIEKYDAYIQKIINDPDTQKAFQSAFGESKEDMLKRLNSAKEAIGIYGSNPINAVKKMVNDCSKVYTDIKTANGKIVTILKNGSGVGKKQEVDANGNVVRNADNKITGEIKNLLAHPSKTLTLMSTLNPLDMYKMALLSGKITNKNLSTDGLTNLSTEVSTLSIKVNQIITICDEFVKSVDKLTSSSNVDAIMIAGKMLQSLAGSSMRSITNATGGIADLLGKIKASSTIQVKDEKGNITEKKFQNNADAIAEEGEATKKRKAYQAAKAGK